MYAGSIWVDSLDSHGYEFIYNLIETLLYEANYNETTQQGRFLELWGQKGYTRKVCCVMKCSSSSRDGPLCRKNKFESS